MSHGKNLDAEWNDFSKSLKNESEKLDEKSRYRESNKSSPKSNKMDVDKKESNNDKIRDSRHESKSKKDDKRDRRDSRDRDRRHKHGDRRDRRKHRSSSRSSSGSRRRDRRSSREKKRDDEKRRHHSRHSRSRSRSRDNNREKKDSRENDDRKAIEILKKIEIPKELKNDKKLVAKYQAEELKKKAEEMSGVKIPSFYNTSTVNPLTLAEQQRKRKLLWSKSKDNENTSTKMIGKAIIEGQDEKTAEKFRKLMGIKSGDELKDGNTIDKIHTMQKQAFDDLDKEYEYARMTTHLNRGKGLGFASHTATILMDANQRLQLQ